MSAASSDSENGPALGPAKMVVIEFAVPNKPGETRSCAIEARFCLTREVAKLHGPVLFRGAQVGNPTLGGRGAPPRTAAANRTLAAGEIAVFHELRQCWDRCHGWFCTGLRHTVNGCNGPFIV